jgi:hypothetical protein
MHVQRREGTSKHLQMCILALTKNRIFVPYTLVHMCIFVFVCACVYVFVCVMVREVLACVRVCALLRKHFRTETADHMAQ